MNRKVILELEEERRKILSLSTSEFLQYEVPEFTYESATSLLGYYELLVYVLEERKRFIQDPREIAYMDFQIDVSRGHIESLKKVKSEFLAAKGGEEKSAVHTAEGGEESAVHTAEGAGEGENWVEYFYFS